MSLPLVAPRVPSPMKLIDELTGPARRSMAARLFMGDMDIAAYSGNWDLQGRVLPHRACVYCYNRLNTFPCVEDEWHVLLICPLYRDLRRSLSLSAEAIRVEGHPSGMQGDGCTRRNLIALIRSIMLHPRFDHVIDFLMQAMKRRGQYRRNSYSGPFQ